MYTGRRILVLEQLSLSFLVALTCCEAATLSFSAARHHAAYLNPHPVGTPSLGNVWGAGAPLSSATQFNELQHELDLFQPCESCTLSGCRLPSPAEGGVDFKAVNGSTLASEDVPVDAYTFASSSSSQFDLPDGTVVRYGDGNQLYLVKNGQVHPFLSVHAALSWGIAADGAVSLPTSARDSTSVGDTIDFRDGTNVLYQGETRARPLVYRVANGRRSQYISDDVMRSHGIDPSDSRSWLALPPGHPVHAVGPAIDFAEGTLLVRASGADNTFYKVRSDGSVGVFTSESLVRVLKHDPGLALSATDEVMQRFAIGVPVSWPHGVLVTCPSMDSDRRVYKTVPGGESVRLRPFPSYSVYASWGYNLPSADVSILTPDECAAMQGHVDPFDFKDGTVVSYCKENREVLYRIDGGLRRRFLASYVLASYGVEADTRGHVLCVPGTPTSAGVDTPSEGSADDGTRPCRACEGLWLAVPAHADGPPIDVKPGTFVTIDARHFFVGEGHTKELTSAAMVHAWELTPEAALRVPATVLERNPLAGSMHWPNGVLLTSSSDQAGGSPRVYVIADSRKRAFVCEAALRSHGHTLDSPSVLRVSDTELAAVSDGPEMDFADGVMVLYEEDGAVPPTEGGGLSCGDGERQRDGRAYLAVHQLKGGVRYRFGSEQMLQAYGHDRASLTCYTVPAGVTHGQGGDVLYPDGVLVRMWPSPPGEEQGPEDGAVYLLQAGQRRMLLPVVREMLGWGGRTVYDVEDGRVHEYPLNEAAPVLPPDGSLVGYRLEQAVKGAPAPAAALDRTGPRSSGAVFLVEGGKKRFVSSSEVFRQREFAVKDIKTLPIPFLDALPAGPTVGLLDSLRRGGDGLNEALYLWLSLPADRFWVNLHPERPDFVMDEAFGSTKVGMVLLEADLQMKRSVGQLTHPDSELGERFWEEFYEGVGHDEDVCFSFRQWIVPGNVTVVRRADAFEVLNATLEVQLESQYLRVQGLEAQNPCPVEVDPRIPARAEELFRKRILPRLSDAINSAAEYEDVRTMFYYRILSNYYREMLDKDPHAAAAFASKVTEGMMKSWQLGADNRRWSPAWVWRRYSRSAVTGEYKMTKRSKDMKSDTPVTTSYFYGGVDWTNLRIHEV